jgi:hypothetical protein
MLLLETKVHSLFVYTMLAAFPMAAPAQDGTPPSGSRQAHGFAA